MYYYWAYGLIVKSELAFPELFPISMSNDVDLEIELGEMPNALMHEVTTGKNSRIITSSEYILIIPGVSGYYAGYGKKIIIQKEQNADWESVRLFCLSNAFAAILYQRKLIPLHCSAFLFQEQLILIFGDSGAGKSTTLGAMLNRGYKVFSDDVCVPLINKDSGELTLFSSYPMLKYWKTTISKLNINPQQLSRQIRPDMQKYGLYFHDKFIINHKKPMLNFVLNVSQSTDSVFIHPINGIELFKQLEHNAYRGEQLGYANLKKEHFNLFTRLANQCASFLIQRPKDVDSLDQIADMIEDKISVFLKRNID